MVNLWIQFYVLPFLDFSYFQSSPSPGWFYQLLVVVKVLITNQLRPHLATDFGDWVVVFGSTNFGFIWLPLAVVFIHFSHSPTFRRLVFQVCYQWIRCIDLVIGLAPLDRGGRGAGERRGEGGGGPYPSTPLYWRGGWWLHLKVVLWPSFWHSLGSLWDSLGSLWDILICGWENWVRLDSFGILLKFLGAFWDSFD